MNRLKLFFKSNIHIYKLTNLICVCVQVKHAIFRCIAVGFDVTDAIRNSFLLKSVLHILVLYDFRWLVLYITHEPYGQILWLLNDGFNHFFFSLTSVVSMNCLEKIKANVLQISPCVFHGKSISILVWNGIRWVIITECLTAFMFLTWLWKSNMSCTAWSQTD